MESTALDLSRLTDRRLFSKPFRSVAVLGAGTMGGQIAAHFANIGMDVSLLDIAADGDDKNAIVNSQFGRTRKMKPSPFFSDAIAGRVRLGNFDDNLEWIADVDWVLEVVVERLDIKQSLMARIEAAVRDDAVITTNTSGLPIAQVAEGRSIDFRRRFLGTHFFNPPRYLKLLELIPTDDTDPNVLARVAEFGRVHLGKGIVIAKDQPYFIGNRVGIYGMMSAISHLVDGNLSIEEIDALTGPLTGRPKSATFRTADVVGLDVLNDVLTNLYKAVPEDESVEQFKVPEVLSRLVARGSLGAKSREGFYKKEGAEIKSVDSDTLEYRSPAPVDIENLDDLKKAGSLSDRLRALYDDQGKAGRFFRATALDTLGYAARRAREIAYSPADVDRAIKWGFGWQAGPFEMWDAIGTKRVLGDMREAGISVPDWVDEAVEKGGFYASEDGRQSVFSPDTGAYDVLPVHQDELSLATIKVRPETEIWSNEEAALLDIGEQVVLYEFRSKANTIGQNVSRGLIECIDRVENDPNIRGLVVGNEGVNFSVGANLSEGAMAVLLGDFDQLAATVEKFQRMVQRVRYAAKPVVVAAHQRVLGGGCELTMASPFAVAAAESYMGLVELGVGLIPAGTGATTLAALAADQAPNGFDSEIQAALQRLFLNVAMAKVATSASEAKEMGYLSPHATIVNNTERRLSVARDSVVQLSNAGYMPPQERPIKVLGAPGRSALEIGAYQFLQGRFISEYDFYLASRLAWVMTGGDLTGPDYVDEEYMLRLEREVFVELVKNRKTQDRIEHILKTNKPLRN